MILVAVVILGMLHIASKEYPAQLVPARILAKSPATCLWERR